MRDSAAPLNIPMPLNSVRMWVQGSGFGVWGLGFRVWGLGLRVWGLGFEALPVLVQAAGGKRHAVPVHRPELLCV